MKSIHLSGYFGRPNLSLNFILFVLRLAGVDTFSCVPWLKVGAVGAQVGSKKRTEPEREEKNLRFL